MSFRFPTCAKCGRSVNPDHPGTYRLVEGWLKQRKGGGAHAIRHARLLGKFMHGHCMAGSSPAPQVEDLDFGLNLVEEAGKITAR